MRGRDKEEEGHTEVIDDLAEAVVLPYIALAAHHQGSIAANQLRLVCVLLRPGEGGCDSDQGEDVVNELHRYCGYLKKVHSSCMSFPLRRYQWCTEMSKV